MIEIDFSPNHIISGISWWIHYPRKSRISSEEFGVGGFSFERNDALTQIYIDHDSRTETKGKEDRIRLSFKNLFFNSVLQPTRSRRVAMTNRDCKIYKLKQRESLMIREERENRYPMSKCMARRNLRIDLLRHIWISNREISRSMKMNELDWRRRREKLTFNRSNGNCLALVSKISLT